MVQYFTQHAHMLLMDLFRVCAWLAILSIIFVPLERLFAVHREKIFRAQIGPDLGYYFINDLIPALLLSVPLGLAGGAVHYLIPADFHAAVGGMPFWARLPAALVVGETGYYWGHRMMHEVPALWRFHSVHHSARHIDFLVSSRAHPIDIVFGRLCATIPLYVVGLAGPAGAAAGTLPVLINLGGMIWGFFIHANVRWRLGPLEWLVTSPAFHHWHHTLAEPTNRNYASTLPWLDRIFGTFHLPKGRWPTDYGIKETMPESWAVNWWIRCSSRVPGPSSGRSDDAEWMDRIKTKTRALKYDRKSLTASNFAATMWYVWGLGANPFAV